MVVADQDPGREIGGLAQALLNQRLHKSLAIEVRARILIEFAIWRLLLQDMQDFLLKCLAKDFCLF